MDVVSKSKRKEMMSRIPNKGTGIEIQVRKILLDTGYRYRLHPMIYGSTPDIFILKHKVAVFVHGCFWHGHYGCKYGHVPKSNKSFWLEKISNNRQRDFRNRINLLMRNVRVLEVWECSLKGKYKKKQEVLEREIVDFIDGTDEYLCIEGLQF